MAKKKQQPTTNGIYVKDGEYFILCGSKEHRIRTEGRIIVGIGRTPSIAPIRTPVILPSKAST